MSILNVEHLSHGFGDRAIFTDVSFRLLKGEHIGLVGANGEGKSTFMNIITGSLMPDEGKIEEEGERSPETTFQSNIPALKGSAEGLVYSISSVSPNTDKITIGEDGQPYTKDGILVEAVTTGKHEDFPKNEFKTSITCAFCNKRTASCRSS